jgi:hypothetical protein
VFKNSATKAAEYANTARTVGSAVVGSIAGLGAKKASGSTTATTNSGSLWSKWGSTAYVVGGALAAGAAVGGAYYKREDLGMGYTWATDHLKYVRNLWDEDALKRRVDSLLDVETEMGVVFRTCVILNIIQTRWDLYIYIYICIIGFMRSFRQNRQLIFPHKRSLSFLPKLLAHAPISCL